MTLLAGAVALSLVVIQFSWANDRTKADVSLKILDDRTSLLETETNRIKRDSYCVPLSAFSRELDARLAPDARVFVAGMLGPTNYPKTGYYYSLKNYLFPRNVEISLDGKSFASNDAFYGIPCDSPEVLQSNGFDLMIRFDNGPELIPLTPKGVLSPE